MRSKPLAITLTVALATAALLHSPAGAASFNSAQITKAVNDVKLLPHGGSARPAAEGNTVKRNTSVLTGRRSRAELTFPDASLIRLGQNTSFSFLDGKREVDLKEGTMLLQQPKWRGRTEIRTAAVSAAITGTTVILESSKGPDACGACDCCRGVCAINRRKHHDACCADKAGIVKLLVLEGSMRFNLNAAPNKSLTLKAGEMVSMVSGATQIPRVFVFDIKQLVKTSGLINGEFAPLARLDKIDDQADAQTVAKERADLLSVNIALASRKPRFLGLFRPPPIDTVQNVRNQTPMPPPPMSAPRPPRPEPRAPRTPRTPRATPPPPPPTTPPTPPSPMTEYPEYPGSNGSPTTGQTTEQ